MQLSIVLWMCIFYVAGTSAAQDRRTTSIKWQLGKPDDLGDNVKQLFKSIWNSLSGKKRRRQAKKGKDDTRVTNVHTETIVQYLCEDGSYRRNCNEVCNCLYGNGGCNRVTGRCAKSACQDGYYGIRCKEHCSDTCHNRQCDFDTGECLHCEFGLYGKQCDKDCSGHCLGFKCDLDTGNCIDCIPGFFGKRCEKDCSDNCKDFKCDIDSGECVECRRGFFGKHCEKECNSNCLNKICHQGNGTCIRCEKGKNGNHCHKECNSNCLNRLCHQGNGTCIKCEKGKTGTVCQIDLKRSKKKSLWPIFIGLVIGIIVVGLGLGIAVKSLKKKLQRSEENVELSSCPKGSNVNDKEISNTRSTGTSLDQYGYQIVVENKKKGNRSPRHQMSEKKKQSKQERSESYTVPDGGAVDAGQYDNAQLNVPDVHPTGESNTQARAFDNQDYNDVNQYDEPGSLNTEEHHYSMAATSVTTNCTSNAANNKTQCFVDNNKHNTDGEEAGQDLSHYYDTVDFGYANTSDMAHQYATAPRATPANSSKYSKAQAI